MITMRITFSESICIIVVDDDNNNDKSSDDSKYYNHDSKYDIPYFRAYKTHPYIRRSPCSGH